MKKWLSIFFALALCVSASVGLAKISYAGEDSEDSSQSVESEDPDDDKDDDKYSEKQNKIQEKIEEAKKRRQEWMIKKAEIRADAKAEREKYKEMRQKFTEERCEKIEARIQKRTGNYGSSKEKHMSVYNNLVNRITKFANRFKTAGLENTAEYKELMDDLKTLEDHILEFKAAYAAYIAKLKATKTYACGQSEGNFRAQLDDARAELKIVHGIAAEIRKFVRTDILDDLRKLKALMPKEKDDDNDEDEDEDEKISVTITFPANNSTYTAAGSVSITAKAEDDDHVSKVEFYDGDTLKGTDTTEPYNFNWAFVSADNGAHSWTAKAYDKATPANSVVSGAVNLTVNIASTP